ncbi:MAG TPA: sulfite exporter TauE/SafE family protein [Vicinamibacterales bacterium]|nr:sulfite exporter TauE/SafE family protein [Vicinamibacterales bacterium]
MFDPGLAALAAIGFVAAVINVIAGGGSFLTLPLLLFLGLPASVANGTNRVGVLAQNVSAVLGFHRHQALPLRWALGVSVPAVAGAALGVWAALLVPDVAFRRILSLVMLAMTFGTLLRRSRSSAPVQELRHPWHWTMLAGFFVTGVYGGFLQAGVGFLSLAMTSLAGLDLVRGNAVKVFTVMLLTLLSLAVFAGTGHVDWPAGAALGLGNLLGGIVGVRVAVLKGHRWLERVVTATIVVFAVLLWITG